MDIIVTDHSVENLEAKYENKHLYTTKDYSLMCEETVIPWLQIIPNRSLAEDTEYAAFLYKEAHDIANKLVKEGFPKHINIAKIGNKLPYYHIHIVFREERDEAWPEPVWCPKILLTNKNQAVLFKNSFIETY